MIYIFFDNHIQNQIMLHINRRYFSILNKIRQRERGQNPAHKIHVPPKMAAYQYNDIVGTTSYAEQKNNLTPYQQYLIETNSIERPFTGNLWSQHSVGFYHCAVCATRLFSFDQKIKSKIGLTCFFDCVQQRVRVVNEKANFDMVNCFANPLVDEEISRHQRIQCGQCGSNIGALWFDGPYPTFLRFIVNSSLLKFVDMEDFPDPNIERKQKQKEKEALKVEYI